MPYVDADSFTTLASVEGRVQRGSFTASTAPTTDQVREFMALRAAEVQSVLASNGLTYTVPSGASPIPAGYLARLCALANTLGAAGDALAAIIVRDTPGGESLAAEFWKQYGTLLESIGTASEGTAAAGSSYVAPSTPEIDVDDLFNHGTQW